MLPEHIVGYCLTKRGAFLCHPFGPDSDIIKVGTAGRARIFAQVFTWKGEPAVTLSCDAASGELYRAMFPGVVTRGYHCPPVQQPYFNTMPLSGGVPDDKLLEMIDLAYKVVSAKLPRAVQAEIGVQAI